MDLESILDVMGCKTRRDIISLLPDDTAEASTKLAPTEEAYILAKVVLPTPGGPHKISENGASDLIIRLRIAPSPLKCSCPTNSVKFLGLNRKAKFMPPL